MPTGRGADDIRQPSPGRTSSGSPGLVRSSKEAAYRTGGLCFARKFPDDGGELTGMVDSMIRSRERDGLEV